MSYPKGFAVSHLEVGAFEPRGLRSFFEYRDLGIAEATDGKVGMHVIRAKEGHEAEPNWHRHDLEFQIVFVLKGWVTFEYEGVGEVTLKPGSCVHQAPGIRHREVAHSHDMELIEITGPADFGTEEVEAPTQGPMEASIQAP